VCLYIGSVAEPLGQHNQGFRQVSREIEPVSAITITEIGIRRPERRVSAAVGRYRPQGDRRAAGDDMTSFIALALWLEFPISAFCDKTGLSAAMDCGYVALWAHAAARSSSSVRSRAFCVRAAARSNSLVR
jgi:hypothetical protein